ncbi:hypothetical protein M3B43_01030 [Nesterenkonia massiliensis]|uniref:Uncharacterized protein n=1 Tax=Nesterenkonia massiliensis TaxID=1232429 RepID=A0ABT2HMK5_9MICC|nr:hypothetical protein [Nesterenkonia massiliensis]MCT1605923.1 hypothetical protein [Nesterenkonia massiliensis]
MRATRADGELFELPIVEDNGRGRFEPDRLPAPIRSLEVIDPTGRHFVHLKNLFPRTNQEYVATFTSKRNRPQRPQLDYFIGRQIAQHFQGAAGYRISGAIVCAYKAVELLDAQRQTEAEGLLDEAWSLLPETQLQRSVRLNRETLTLSILSAKWHLQLAQCDHEAFLTTLLRIEELSADQAFTSYYNPAYNASRALRQLALYYKALGNNDAAIRVSDLSFALFKLAARDADQNVTQFQELGFVHNHVYETMRFAHRAQPLTEQEIQKQLSSSVRISEKTHPSAVAILMDIFTKTVRAAHS